MQKLRILIADDQTLMRDGLKTILDLEDDLEVVGTAGNGLEAYEMTAALLPDLVLMDVKMPVLNGVESVKRIKRDFPETHILMLTTFDEEEYIIESLANGAIGFLLKDVPGDKLVETIREAAKGQTILPSPVAAKLAACLSKSAMIVAEQSEFPGKRPALQFTKREMEIIYYMIRNYNNKEIAEKLGIAEGTLKNYITGIYEKIGTNERLKAISYLKQFIFGADIS